MARMNANIPLSGSVPNILGALDTGALAAQRANEIQTQNALRAYMQEQGPAMFAGDTNALRGYAQFDAPGAVGLQDMFDTRAWNAELRDMERQRFDAEMNPPQDEEAFMDGVIRGALVLSAEGDPARVAAWFEQNNVDPAAIPMDMIPVIAAQRGIFDAGDLRDMAAPQEFDPERYRVVDGNLVDLMAPTGPAAVNFGGQPSGPNTVINNNMPDPTGGVTDNFYEKLDTAQAEMFGALLNQGMTAPSRLAQVDELDSLLSNVPGGFVTAAQVWLGDRGIPTDGLAPLEAANAIINRLVPEQRAPGSGPMSDRDIEMFRASLPRLINTPQGNQLIVATIRGMVVYEQMQAEIANRVASREITPAQGREMLMALDNPLQVFRTSDEAVTIQGGDWQDVGDGIQIRRID